MCVQPVCLHCLPLLLCLQHAPALTSPHEPRGHPRIGPPATHIACIWYILYALWIKQQQRQAELDDISLVGQALWNLDANRLQAGTEYDINVGVSARVLRAK